MRVLSFTTVFPLISPMNLRKYKAGYAHDFPFRSHKDSLVKSGLIKLLDRSQELVDKLFKEVEQNKENISSTAFSLLLMSVGRTLETNGNFGPFSRRTDFVIALLPSMPSKLKLCFYSFTIFLFFNKSQFYCSSDIHKVFSTFRFLHFSISISSQLVVVFLSSYIQL